jgi:hypothetical protein
VEVGVIVMVYIGREKMEVMHKVVIVRYSLTSLCRRDKDSRGGKEEGTENNIRRGKNEKRGQERK